MKRIFLITVLCLSAGISKATFEIEDPSKIVEQDIKNATEAAEAAQALTEDEVIVAIGTDLYVPIISGGHCDGWHFDDSEPGLNDSGDTHNTTQTTYIGVTVKTVNCKNESDGETRHFSLVRINKGRLIWVESGRILSAN